MGVVYRAWQGGLRRWVALKTIWPGIATAPAFLARFQAEAETAAQLEHPNIVPLHDFGEIEGQPFFTMQLLEGGSLAERMADWELTAQAEAPGSGPESSVARGSTRAARVAAAAGLIAKVARAVYYAHQRGVLHRDLKPSNILLNGSGEPMLADFGLAKLVEAAGDLTASLEFLGSPNYAAPEQVSGGARRVTVAADVYGLGAILYRLATGRPPFEAETPLATLQQVVQSPPRKPRGLNPSLPADLETICLRCLEKQPERRYPSALALAEDLERFIRGEPIQARPATAGEQLWRWCRMNPVPAVLGVSVVTLLIALALGSLAAVRGIREQRDTARVEHDRAEEAVRRLGLERIEDLFNAGDGAGAMARLAEIVRAQPSNRIAGERLLSALAFRGFAWPTGPAGNGANRAGGLVNRLKNQNPVAKAADATQDGAGLALVKDRTNVIVVSARDGTVVAGPFSHPDRIRMARFSPEGERVVTAAEDGTAQVWDVRTAQPIGTRMLHESVVYAAVFSPDGRRVATGSKDKTARVWDAVTGQASTPPLEHRERVSAVQFSADGNWLATGTRDGLARAWDAASGRPRGEPMRHTREVDELEFGDNGLSLCVGLAGGEDRVWRFGPPAGPAVVCRHADRVDWVEFSPNGRRLAVAAGKEVAIWELPAGRLAGTPLPYPEPLHMVQFSPDGQSVLAACSSGLAFLLPVPLSQDHVLDYKHDAAFSPDGLRVATASFDRTARLWDAATGLPLSEPLRHEGQVMHVSFSADGRWLATASHDRTARVWPVPVVDAPAPAWLPQLAEAVGGWRVGETGFLETSFASDLAELRAQLGRVDPSVSLASWAGWFAGERDGVPIPAER
jgi:WD40 repeat protein